MTLRYDNHGRPIGLDWTVCNDGNPQPLVWDPDYTLKLAQGKKPKHPYTLRPGIGRGGNVWMGAELEAQIIDVYELTNHTPTEISRMFGFTLKTFYRVLKRNDIQLKSRRAA